MGTQTGPGRVGPDRVGSDGVRPDQVEPDRVGPDQVELDRFEGEAIDFLRANATPRVDVEAEWGQGSDRIAVVPESTPEEDRADLRAAQQWSRAVFDAGFGWITGPPRYGGRGLTAGHERRWHQLAARFETPSQSLFGIGLGMVAPTILAHAGEPVRQRYLAPMHRGDIVGCQLFSEPGAGSDLAGLQTRAERDGDEWVLNGQKVWTSYAHLADIGEIICRTDPDAPRHKGLTGFVVDMQAPGVDVRPLRQMTGGASFNEVFFTDVRVPDDHRLGDVNRGWSVALTTLMNERASIGGGGAGGGAISRVIDLARHSGRSGDPLIRQELARAVVNGRVAALTTQRAMSKVAAGHAPGPEMSIAKMALTQNMGHLCDLVSSILGPELVADSGRWGTYAWSEFVVGHPGIRIAGGTDEVLRNIVGERVLGLPKDPAPR